MDELQLLLLTAEYAEQIAAYRQAFLDSGDSMDGTGTLRDCHDPLDWVHKSEEIRHEEGVPQGWVPATQLICVRKCDHKLVGMIQIRHCFNDYLEKYGGHIGYSVHPQFRRKGYAKWMLQNALPFCRQLGLKRMLVTCAADNEGSRKVILANGGMFENTVLEPKEHKSLERYWITL